MKKLLLLATSIGYLYSHSVQMPPMMPPMIPTSTKSTVKSVNTTSKKDEKIAKKAGACDMIPPMLHLLPPPLQEALDKCQIEKFFPKEEAVKKYLNNKKIKYEKLTITPVKDFIRVYKIDLGNKNFLYCNGMMTNCLQF